MGNTQSDNLYGYVQQNGVRVAELRDEKFEDMFWRSFRVVPLGSGNGRVLENPFWDEEFHIEHSSTGVVFKHVFSKMNGALDRPNRVWLRWGAGANSPNEIRELAAAALRKLPWWRRLLHRLR